MGKMGGGRLLLQQNGNFWSLSLAYCQHPQRAPCDDALTEKADIGMAVSRSRCDSWQVILKFWYLAFFSPPVNGNRLNPPHHQASVFQKDFPQQVIGRQ